MTDTDARTHSSSIAAADRANSGAPPAPGAERQQVIEVPDALVQRLRSFSRAERVTAPMVVLAAYAVLTTRCTGQERVQVLWGLDGVADVPVAVDCPGGLRFVEVLRRVRDAVLDAVAGAGPIADALAGEALQTAFHDRAPDAVGSLPARTVDWRLVLLHGSVTGIVLRHRASGADDDLAACVAAAFVPLLEDAVAHPATTVRDLCVLSAAQYPDAVQAGRGPSPAAARSGTLHSLFAAQARRTPLALALADSVEEITYAEADRRANRIAHRLRALGARPETVVGLSLPRSTAAIIAVLGILKAGGAYLPLDPALPSERLAYMMADAGMSVLVTDRATRGQLPPHRGAVLVLDDERPDADHGAETDPAVPVHPDNLAYVIYTSGSTGRPKGVEIAHRGVVNLAEAVRALGVTGDDRVAQFASLAFDASVWETVLALTTGACLCIIPTNGLSPADIAATLTARRVTVGTFPPSFLGSVDPARLDGLRLVVSAGEACGAALADAWAQGRRFINAYGPTETTVCLTYHDVMRPVRDRTGPAVGRPLAGTAAHVLDAALRPVGPGMPGEVHAAGLCLARGYRNRASATAAAFLPDPYGPPGSRLYRTGDVGSRRTDGALRHIGRVDRQVKLRGFRIEPEEIEAVLRGHPAVRQAAVGLRDLPGSGPQLVAYVALRSTLGAEAPALSIPVPDAAADGKRAVAELRSFLAALLPGHMVPGHIVVLDKLPTTASGKADLQALASAAEMLAAEDDRPEAAMTPTQERLSVIWSRMLGLSSVALQDNFLEIGGHSLVAAQVIARVRREFQLSALPVRVLFEQPVLADFAAAVDAALAAPAAEVAR